MLCDSEDKKKSPKQKKKENDKLVNIRMCRNFDLLSYLSQTKIIVWFMYRCGINESYRKLTDFVDRGTVIVRMFFRVFFFFFGRSEIVFFFALQIFFFIKTDKSSKLLDKLCHTTVVFTRTHSIL